MTEECAEELLAGLLDILVLEVVEAIRKLAVLAIVEPGGQFVLAVPEPMLKSLPHAPTTFLAASTAGRLTDLG